MIDPKILLDAILAGTAKQGGTASAAAAEPAQALDLNDILRRMGAAPPEAPQRAPMPPSAGGGLGDLLEKLGKAAQQQQRPQAGGPQGPGQGDGGGSLGDILSEIFGRAAGGGSGSGPRPAPTPGGRMDQGGGQPGQDAPRSRDLLEEIFGPQGGGARAPSTQSAPTPPPASQQPAPVSPRGTPWGSGTGRGGAIDARHEIEDILSAIASGNGTPDMIARLQQMVEQGQASAGAVIGGLGSLVVRDRPGRRIQAAAAHMGGVELVGAIAYDAYLAYQQGRQPGQNEGLPSGPAPAGSGFEPAAQTADSVLLYVRAMMAAAAADGDVDAGEQQQILGGLELLGLGAHVSEFLQDELTSPKTVQELVAAVGSPVVALQTYAAARLAIEPHSREEAAFLQSLAQGLGIDAGLAAHIDAQTTRLKA